MHTLMEQFRVEFCLDTWDSAFDGFRFCGVDVSQDRESFSVSYHQDAYIRDARNLILSLALRVSTSVFYGWRQPKQRLAPSLFAGAHAQLQQGIRVLLAPHHTAPKSAMDRDSLPTFSQRYLVPSAAHAPC